MKRHDRFDGYYGIVSPLILPNLLADIYQLLRLALAASRVPRHLERHAALARFFRGRQSHWRIHGRRELISCRALNAAIMAALVADLRVVIVAIIVSLASCSDSTSLTSWPSWCPVVVVRGVNATVTQSMRVMAFFKHHDRWDGHRWDHDHKCHRSWGRCDTPQPNRHSDLRVGC